MINKLILFSTAFIGFAGLVNAQVGIGNATPNAKSILDLTNATNGKALILPQPIAPISLVGNFDTEAMVFYYQDKVYVRTSTGMNVLSPWIFDGTVANGIYVASGTPVGIGIAPIVSSTAILTIADAAADVTETGSAASIVIGDNDFSATHMLLDEDEIMVKTNATTAGLLKFQEENGTVQIRSSTADAGVVTVLTAYGSVDAKGKIKENGNDLLPVGAIIMWNGTTVPTGWALCDGGTYTLDAGGTITTPNLMDRFIIGADATNGTSIPNVGSYAYGNFAGGTTHTLAAANLPNHQHEAGSNSASMNITASGAHSHTSQATYLVDNDDNDDTSCAIGYSCGSDAVGSNGSTGSVSSTGSTHTHPNGNFAGVTGLGVGLGGATTTITHGLPPYFALAFIMKL